MKRLQALWDKPEKLIVGLMSGTSVDAIDAALVKVSGHGRDTSCQLLHYVSRPYPEAVRAEIFQLFSPERSRVDHLCSMNFVIGMHFADAVEQLLAETGLPKSAVDLIGSHGQTVYHIPPGMDTSQTGLVPSTLQIGEASVIAERIGCPVVSDFRVRDMAAGGQGAPLVPYTEYVLYAQPDKNIALQNIGGIGNVTFLPKSGRMDSVMAFDTGPGNMMIDAAMQIITDGRESYDNGGQFAATGQAQMAYIERWLTHPYFSMQAPKSTGRETFGVQHTREIVSQMRADGISDADIVATITRFTAETIADQYRRFLLDHDTIDEVIIGGGGSYNPTLLGCLRELLGTIPVSTQEDKGYASDAKEAIAFAILAHETIMGNPSNVPSATGAAHPCVLGKLSL
ncbi:anhydro-N-acetylmuramic acid kinase [Brevibacillus dissolubilis]|uniref:anhydro-N-acetylmuramic acid kinase n=1 Tax=Brevibacillus dissolubilis TaxID=1844116 RepID=UPI001115D084|nr:anhydro-N-acetylmuramic acid kinase [Brevibacillus dissolubilis]